MNHSFVKGFIQGCTEKRGKTFELDSKSSSFKLERGVKNLLKFVETRVNSIQPAKEDKTNILDHKSTRHCEPKHVANKIQKKQTERVVLKNHTA